MAKQPCRGGSRRRPCPCETCVCKDCAKWWKEFDEPTSNPGVKELGFIYPGHLPDDMQVMILDLAFTVGDLPDTEASQSRIARTKLPLMEVPLAYFPPIDPASDDNDERDFESYAETPMEEYPPVVIANGNFIDGRHRVWAAREQGVEAIKAIDISCLVPSTLEGLGPMRFPRGARVPKCKFPR